VISLLAEERFMRGPILGTAMLAGGLLMFGQGDAADGPRSYPAAKKIDHVDDYHGTKVPDPYRWLEDDVRKSNEVKAWVDAENEVTGAYLRGIPQREHIQKRLTELWNFERYSAPSKVGGRYFYRKNDGLQNQAVLYTLDKLDREPRVLIDPNAWSKDGTISLEATSPGPDGKYLAYSVSEAGSDWQKWKVLDIATGMPLADELKWVKFSEASWTADGKGFFYSRFPEPAKDQQFQSLNKNQSVYYHRVGAPQSDDVVVYRRPDQPEWGFTTAATDDGRYLIITTYKGTDDRFRITYRDLSEPYAMAVDLIDHFDNDYTFVDNDGPVFYFRTDLKAPNGRVIAIDIRKPEPTHWKEIVPEAKDKLESAKVVGNLLVARYLKDARSLVKIFTLEGEFVRDVQLPGLGTAAGFEGKRSDTETFYQFSSFNRPPTLYRYDLISGKGTVFRESKVPFDPDQYDVKQEFYTSKDGTRVPIFIVSKKGLKLDGTNPTILYGYGGFNISVTPTFSTGIIGWLEMGGVYAVANLRGGGEYGKEWHKAGTKSKKQNVFDDFIAAAEYLVKEKYTSTPKLAIRGGSNGGLLVGAVMTQRPDLFGAALPHVGVMDMLRFHQFTAGRYWVDDYGSSDNAEEFKTLRAYSPYHNLKPDTRYPATMVITADTDDRVVPGHSFKFAAMLQACQAKNGPPVMARIETRAGHGAGKPTAKVIEELADEYAFLAKVLGMK
jgi:prolyl oligopeptidase